MKKKIVKGFKKCILIYAYGSAILASLFVLLALTDIPYYAYQNLSLKKQQLQSKADVIVLMGGDGMPSPNGLMRLYFTAQLAKENPMAKVVIAMPLNEVDSTYQLDLMAKELMNKNIDSNRIIYEYKGFNTRTQAVSVGKMFPLKSKLIVVSSPEHMYRAVKSFEKVGFESVGSYPTFEVPSDEELLISKEKEKKADEVHNLGLRYNLWSYMQYEIRVLREYLAITYYWLKGWI
jgi:uncharacterized SAM-binding protein YcdF (DUF218 family)